MKKAAPRAADENGSASSNGTSSRQQKITRASSARRRKQAAISRYEALLRIADMACAQAAATGEDARSEFYEHLAVALDDDCPEQSAAAKKAAATLNAADIQHLHRLLQPAEPRASAEGLPDFARVYLHELVERATDSTCYDSGNSCLHALGLLMEGNPLLRRESHALKHGVELIESVIDPLRGWAARQ